MRLREFCKKYNHALVFLYAFIYMPWFVYLEHHVTSDFYLIHSPIDDYIPFLEIFIVPYLLWFLYISVGALWLFFKDKKEFLKLAAFAIAGMTIFLIICTVFPNGLNLRPAEFARDNVFTDLVKFIYASDTPTNVLPSMHVFLSVSVCMALNRSASLREHAGIRRGSIVLTVLIILSIMFLKQHSVTDVAAALVMTGVLYQIIYVKEEK